MSKKPKSTKSFSQRREKENASKFREQGRTSWTELWWLLPALILGFLVYVNTLGGEFVYDDLRQVVRNTLIQDSSKFWQALSSDVWAFKGGDEAVSNYWRPSFVFWMIINFRCFGLSVFGWHVTNILLHVAVVALAFTLSRRLNVSPPLAGAIALIFAVHPAHSESVAWISGAPDLVLGAAMLGSMCFVDLLIEKETAKRWVLALFLYAVALGAKEVAFLYPAIVMVLVLSKMSQSETKSGWSKAIRITWPFAVVAVLYLVVRLSILGIIERLPGNGASLGQAILTAPAVFAFYLRQMIFPFWIGPSYPLRAISPANISMTNFVIPLIATLLAMWGMIWMARRSGTARIGLAVFLVPLVPAMNVMAFHPEQLVHDRYLYLPLLGFLLMLVPGVGLLTQHFGQQRFSNAAIIVFIFAAITAIPLAAQTLRYNEAWISNLALWEWGVQSDPTSAFNFEQYGVQLQRAKRLDEAVQALNRSIEIESMPTTYVARATTLIDQNKFEAAGRDLRQVTAKEVAQVAPYTMYQAYERLAILAQQQGKPSQAVDSLMEGRRRLPQYQAALTEKLAVILYQNGEKQQALTELSNVEAKARTESLVESRLVFYRLGLLNMELGHREEARKAFEEFLKLTKQILTPEIKQAGAQSEAALKKL